MAYWLLKSEPDVFAWTDLVAKGYTRWDGVRNYTARNNLKAMHVGDEAFFYHSNAGKHTGIVGICRVTRTADPDTTFTPPLGKPNPWVVVTVEPVKPLPLLTLAHLRSIPALSTMQLFRYGRLSVQGVTDKEWRIIKQTGAL